MLLEHIFTTFIVNLYIKNYRNREELHLKSVITWVTSDSLEGPIPLIDACITPISRLSYLSLRLFFRLLLGRQRRDKIRFLRKFWLEMSPSYMLMAHLHMLNKNKDNVHLIKIQVPRHHYQYFCRVEKGDYIPGHEEHILSRFVPKEGEVVIDIGAHIGKYTILSSKFVGKAGKVVAIEADPDTFQILKRNIVLNNLTNVLPLNYAVFSTRTRIKLYDQSTASAKYNSLILTRTAQTEKYAEVNADTLDSILQINEINEVNWIKIDVEGAEFEVLKGATKTLSGKNIALLIEIHNIEDPRHYDNIIDFLKHYDYEIAFEYRYQGSSESHVIFRKKYHDNN